MIVYIEYVFLENFIINSLIFSSAMKLIAVKVKLRKLIIAAFIAALVSVFYPYIENFILETLIKILLLLIISMIIYTKGEKFSKLLLSLFLTTAFYIGITLVFIHLLGVSDSMIIFFSIVSGVVVFVILNHVLREVFKNLKLSKFIFRLEIFHKGVAYDCKAFFDSGNHLKDEFTGKGIVVMNLLAVEQIFPKLSSMDMLVKNFEKMKDENGREKKVLSISGKEVSMLILTVEKLKVIGEGKSLDFRDVPLGVSLSPLSKDDRYKALIGADYV